MINERPTKYIENSKVLAQYYTATYFGSSRRHHRGVLFAFSAIVSQCLETRQG
jgi:hypothetical protein